MSNFSKIKEALEYIDRHLDQPLSLESLAHQFHFSPYYFHRMFSIIVGKTLAVHVRDRRLMLACARLASTNQSVLTIALDSGYAFAPSFARAFKRVFGLPPSEYRRWGCTPKVITVDQMIRKFTNRLQGGIYLSPSIIKRGALTIAGLSGDGSKTGEVWSRFERLAAEKPLTNKLSDNGYEIRLYKNDGCTVHVGFAISDEPTDSAYEMFKLPPPATHPLMCTWPTAMRARTPPWIGGWRPTIKGISKGRWATLIIAWSIMMSGSAAKRQAPSLKFGYRSKKDSGQPTHQNIKKKSLHIWLPTTFSFLDRKVQYSAGAQRIAHQTFIFISA